MKEEVDKVLKTGDSLGGVFEVVAHQVPPGLGTYVQWDERLDALLAAAVMSLQAVKAVEIGAGVAAAFAPGSAVHDEIGYTASSGYTAFSRTRNNAGGIEGGVSNGQEIRVRGYLKPISTLAPPAAVSRFFDARASQSRLRALRCMCRSRCRRRRGSHGGSHPCPLALWKNSAAIP